MRGERREETWGFTSGGDKVGTAERREREREEMLGKAEDGKDRMR